MVRNIVFVMLMFYAAASVAPTQGSIPPNYSAYTLNPLYTENPTLGWTQQRIEEKLDRGMLAVPIGQGKIYLGWRLLKNDPENIAFNVYRLTDGARAIKLNTEPLVETTDFVDVKVPLDQANAWWVKPVLDGQEQEASCQALLPANPPEQQYKAIKLQYDVRSIDKIGVGDLNGDGTYDFVIKQPAGRIDPGRIRPSPDTFKVEAYNGKTGEFMWQIDLGWNINMGIWFSPMIVYDLDGDNKAEVCLRTAPYAATREEAFDGGKGFVFEGPEYLSVYDGQTGEEIDKVDWIARGKLSDWGDTSGNRASRHMLGIAYLDGKTPSVLVIRGIYGLMKMDAWYLRDKKLHKAWSWSNQTSGWKYQGQGQHNIHVADIDGDGCDEILNGSIAIDNDGRIMWSTGLGHGDRFYITDVDPDRRGLEVWYSYEDPHPQNGVSLWDARTGDLIFGTREEIIDNQIKAAFTADIDQNKPGMECWGDKFFFSSKGEILDGPVPPQDGLVWWDADLLRELVREGGFWSGKASIIKYQGPTLISGIEGRIQVTADILGDWREEIVTFASGRLRIYTTTIPAVDRRVCLMQDPLYRLDVAFRAMGYDQVPMTSYYLGVRHKNFSKATSVQLAQ
jgi:rhamnogalacturonan endolyase